MSVRTCLVTGIFRDPQGTLLAGTTLTWQLELNNPGNAPIIYVVDGDTDSGAVITPSPVEVTLGIDGDLQEDAAFFAPVDLQLNVGGVRTATTGKYVVTGPNGLLYTTTNFAHSADPIPFADIISTSTPGYTQATVHLHNVTPQDAGSAVQVSASLSTLCTLTGYPGQFILPSTVFSVLLDSNGDGDLLLAPNNPLAGGITVPVDGGIDPAQVVWLIDIDGGAQFTIQVPAGGGSIDALIVSVAEDGTVTPLARSPLGALYAAGAIYAAASFH